MTGVTGQGPGVVLRSTEGLFAVVPGVRAQPILSGAWVGIG